MGKKIMTALAFEDISQEELVREINKRLVPNVRYTVNIKSEDEVTHATDNNIKNAKTTLRKKLRSIRKRIVQSGEPLLNSNEIDEELNCRRGGTYNDIK